MTKSQAMTADVQALLRARNSYIHVVSPEEGRVERCVFEAAASAGYKAFCWDVAAGVTDITGNKQSFGDRDPGDMLSFIQNRAKSGDRTVWIMRDLSPWIAGPAGALTLRTLRNTARLLPGAARANAQAIVTVSPGRELPAAIAPHATVLEWPLPDRAEIGAILDRAIESLPDDLKAGAANNGTRDSAIDAALGLTEDESASCFARSLVQLKRIDPVTVAREKRRVVTRAGLLEWFEPLPGGLDSIGGLEVLKGWLIARKSAFTPAARAYGLQAPRGALIVGVPGTGKSMCAKALASAWGCPLLRLDLGALKSKYVGESEQNLRKVFAIIAALGRCIVWVDEIEKALAGATQGAADGGVSSDALGALLSWMQDRQGEAFVIATANDVSALPPELLRKGRFDDVFYVDLPTGAERAAIVSATLRTFGKGAAVDVSTVASACDTFTGAEIAALVPESMFAAYNDGARDITTDDLLTVARATVPLARTAADKIAALRAWVKGRARPASLPETDASSPIGPKLDI